MHSGVDDNDDEDSRNEINSNSQIKDPDFVVNTEDLEEVNTEEFFQPRHKAKVTPAQNSKRKVIKAILSDSCDDDNRAKHDHDKDGESEDTPRRTLRKRVKS